MVVRECLESEHRKIEDDMPIILLTRNLMWYITQIEAVTGIFRVHTVDRGGVVIASNSPIEVP